MLSKHGVARAAIGILGLIVFSVFYGCSSTPAPIIVGDNYTNIEYEYSLKIPRGWEPLDTIPDALNYFEKIVTADRCSLLLYNKESGGLIAIMNSTNRVAYEEYFDIANEQWDKILLNLKASLGGSLEDLTFNHTIKMENLYTTQHQYFLNQFNYKPEKIYGVETDFAVADRRAHVNFDSFLFPCRNTKSCETIVILTCFDKDLARNQPGFEAVLSSLRAHDYYD